MDDFRCPNCGTPFGPQSGGIRMMNCSSCGTSVFIEDDRLRLAGSQGVMHDVPLLIALGDRVRVDGAEWRVLGHARFSYGRGTWDEFWAVKDAGGGVWISVDEGDVVIQSLLDPGRSPKTEGVPPIGTVVQYGNQSYSVTEVETATCEAVRGSLPEELAVGESYRFANCSGADGRLLSGEFWDGGEAWYLGRWVDPFDVQRLTA